MQQPEHHDGRDDRDDGRHGHQPDVAQGPDAERRERVQGQQVGEVGDGKEQGGRVGQPERRHGERQGWGADLTGHRDGHRGQQHRGRVEAEHDGAHHREPDDEQPEHEHASLGDARGVVRHDVEKTRQVADLGDEGDRDEEDEDRRHALDEQAEVEHVRPSGSWRAATDGPDAVGASARPRSAPRAARPGPAACAAPRPARARASRDRGCAWPCARRRGR